VLLPLTHPVFRKVFTAAAAYNLLWGAWVSLLPAQYFQVLGLPVPDAMGLAIWQCVGMCILIYAPGYWWIARQPERFCHYVLIGLLGKTLGPIGMVYSVFNGILPPKFALTCLFNDVLWWLPFWAFAFAAAKARGGWWALLRGD
jgi:hypothetical protein